MRSTFGFKVRCQGSVIGASRGSLRAATTVQVPSMGRGMQTAISCVLLMMLEAWQNDSGCGHGSDYEEEDDDKMIEAVRRGREMWVEGEREVKIKLIFF